MVTDNSESEIQVISESEIQEMTMKPTQYDKRLSRRGFHRSAVAAAAGCLMLRNPMGVQAESAVDATRFPAGKYFDVHTHLGRPDQRAGALTPELLLSWMDEHDVAQAIVLPLVSPEAWMYLITTEFVLEQTEPHRDRLIPFCCIDPRSVYLRGVKGFLGALKRYVNAGAKGFGEHKCAVAIDDPRNMQLFQACAELKLPVLFHMDGVRNTDRPGLPGLEKVLREVPGANFIGHAPGFWNALADGTLDRLMEAYPNLYGDLSAGSGANAISRDLEFGRQFVLRRSDRLLFGTDYLGLNQKVPQFALYEQFDLPADVAAKVFRENTRRLLTWS